MVQVLYQQDTAPAISVVVVTPDRFETIRRTVQGLHSQTIREQIELVIAAPPTDQLGAGQPDLAGFNAVRIVEVGAQVVAPAATAAGVRAASAPVVAMAEDHVLLPPGWAEALLARHREPYAAVAGNVANGNPATAASWAGFLMGYLEWMAPDAGGIATHLPGHNCSYKRALLLQYGGRLEEMLQAESVLHWDLRRQEYQLYLEPRATIGHLNFSRPQTLLGAQLDAGRVFAATRARGWPRLRRLAFAAGAPLIPIVRLTRIIRAYRQPGWPQHLFPRLLPVLIAALVLEALGEMAGYASGSGSALERVSRLEFHREQHMTTADVRDMSAG